MNPAPLLSKLAAVRGHVDAVNLADNSLGRVKMSGLVFGAMVKERLGVSVVLNFSCRDRNRFALKADLLGAGAAGIDAVVALSGDRVASDGPGGARVVHDLDPVGLLRTIGELNRGETGEGKPPLKTLPNLLPGAVANPNRRALEHEFELLRRKAEAGARFVITQPVFDAEMARRFIARARAFGLSVVLGILPVKRAAMATYLKERIPEMSGARAYLDRYDGLSEEQARRLSLAHNMGLMRALAREAAGFDVMSGGGPSLAIELALEFSRWRESLAQHGPEL